MPFKKVTTIIGLVLAFLFVAVLFLHVSSESIYINKHSDNSYIKFNKLTGRIYGLSITNSSKWVRLDNLPLDANKMTSPPANTTKKIPPPDSFPKGGAWDEDKGEGYILKDNVWVSWTPIK